MRILRLCTAGSVDDGKSTLIGRLLYETGSLPSDVIATVRRQSEKLGRHDLDLSLFTDGLRAEREQGITIDVAYRTFSTPRRRFLIADCPGHEQYTRNMVTGASGAELALLVVDVRHGLTTQTRRHAFLATLLGVPHLLVAVNKMDTVEYSQEAFEQLRQDFQDFASRLEARGLTFVPVSALHGDNLTQKSSRMPWYTGDHLLGLLETAYPGGTRNVVDFRFPVQTVLRDLRGERLYAGQVVSGRVKVGEALAVLPSGVKTTLKSIETYQSSQTRAEAGDSVALRLADQVDAGRGDMLVRVNNLPLASDTVDAYLVWLGETALKTSTRYALLHTTRQLSATIKKLRYRVDIDTMHREPAQRLVKNEIGRATLKLSGTLFFDSYRTNRFTGSFLLVDPVTHETVAAGLLRDRARAVEEHVTKARQGVVLWLTGLSGSGKTTLAHEIKRQAGREDVLILDGDQLRQGLCSDLGFSDEDRRENNRRAAHLAALAAEQGLLVIAALISPFAADRAFARSLVPAGRFLEVYLDCSLELCRSRDPKGLYRQVEAGEIPQFTGIDSVYEPPANPEIVLDTAAESPEVSARRVLNLGG